MRRIAITPVYNEEDVVVGVLEEVRSRVDQVIVVNDGSADSSKEKILAWKEKHSSVYFISSDVNEGCSVALRRGYAFVTHLLDTGQIDEDDGVVEIDSDGQHDPRYLDALFERWRIGDADVVLAQRDFSNYPRYKIVGNRGLTLIANILSGVRYKDVESNYRVTAAGRFRDLLRFYTGYRYSAAFEIGIIFGLLGLRTDNELLVKVPHYRPRSRASDGVHVVATGVYTWARLKLGLEQTDVKRFTEDTVARWVR